MMIGTYAHNINTLECVNDNWNEVIKYDKIIAINKKDQNLRNFFWYPNQMINNKIYKLVPENSKKIFDIGCGLGANIFKKATHVLGLDFDRFTYEKDSFDFIYCRHTLEDIQNPQNAFNEIVRIGKKGYIETPSPLTEITKGVSDPDSRGYIHHRYIVWSDAETNTLYFLPKYPIVEKINIGNNDLEKTYTYILNNYPVYWNNYYTWDSEKLPKIMVYRNEVNFNILNDYINILNKAIYLSMNYTNHFINSIKHL